MSELTWILDPATGELVVEGLVIVEEAAALAGDLLPPARLSDSAEALLRGSILA